MPFGFGLNGRFQGVFYGDGEGCVSWVSWLWTVDYAVFIFVFVMVVVGFDYGEGCD